MMLVSVQPAVKIKRDQRFDIEFEGDAVCSVKVGDLVTPTTVVFEGMESRILQSLNLCKELAIKPGQARDFVQKTDGEIVDEGDVVAQRVMSMGMAERFLRAEREGRISLSRLGSGIVDIMAPSSDASVVAGVHGRVEKVMPADGMRRQLVLSVTGYVSRPFLCLGLDDNPDGGVRGERRLNGNGQTSGSGQIYVLKDGNSVYRAADVTNECRDKIVVAGRSISLSLYEALVDAGARGVVVGGISSDDFRDIVNISVPLFVTEGWGMIPVNRVLMDLFREAERLKLAGFMDVKDGNLVLCPEKKLDSEGRKAQRYPDFTVGVSEIAPGRVVQIWDMPYWGYSGKVVGVLEEEELVHVELESRKKVVVAPKCLVVIG